MTYGALKTLIADYLNRDDLTSYIPHFVTLAQRKIERGGTYVVNGERVDIKGYYDCMKERKYSTTSDYYITLPSDFLAPIWLKVKLSTDEFKPLTMMSPEEVLDYYPYLTTDTGEPEQYGILVNQNEILVRPSPDQEYEFDFMYYKSLVALSDDADTNAWTTDYWELLLYGALVEAQTFLMADQRISLWMDMFARELANLEGRDTRAKTSGGRLYVRPFYSI